MLRGLVKKIILAMVPQIRRLKEERDACYQSLSNLSGSQGELNTDDDRRAKFEILDKQVKEGVLRNLYMHSFPTKVKAATGEFPPEPSAPTSDTVKFAERLALVYFREEEHKSEQLFDKDAGIWNLFLENHKEIVDLFAGNKFIETASYLDIMARTPLTHGFAMGKFGVDTFKLNPEGPRLFWSHSLDRLLSLSEAFGTVSVENPEQGDWGKLASLLPDDLLGLIENRLCREVQFPPFNGGLWGLKTSRGLMTAWDPQSLYVANRLIEICGGAMPDRIGEIGAGMGHCAFQAIKAGCEDYTIFDLPTVNIAQSWFLMRNFIDKPLILSDADDPFSIQPAIRVLSTRRFAEVPNNYFDVVINTDSLPEMSEEVALSYLRGLRGKTRYFLSINHEARSPRSSKESHGRVFDLAEKSGGYKRLLRAPYWLRKGYIEELYKVA